METEETLAINAVTFLANPLAVRLSRALVNTSLAAWGYRSLVEDAELIVSELATNAVQARSTGISLIRVAIRITGTTARIAVFDASDDEPKVTDTDYVSDGGRGLFIVEAVSKDWGWQSLGRLGGKVVWAELELPPLPVRVPALPAHTAPVEPVSLMLLGRVRDGLRRL